MAHQHDLAVILLQHHRDHPVAHFLHVVLVEVKLAGVLQALAPTVELMLELSIQTRSGGTVTISSVCRG